MNTPTERIILSELSDFQHHSVALLASARRSVQILSPQLDPLIFSHSEIASELVALLRRAGRHCQIQILISDKEPLLAQDHRLERLYQRLRPAMELRQLTKRYSIKKLSFIVVDGKRLLLQHETQSYRGFVEQEGQVKARQLLEEYENCWQRHSAEIDELKQYYI